MPDARGMNSFEATYQSLVMDWLDAEINSAAEHAANGSALINEDAGKIAMEYAAVVYRIRTLREVKDQLRNIEQDLSGA